MVGVLSTQLLHERFVTGRGGDAPAAAFDTMVDRLSPGPA